MLRSQFTVYDFLKGKWTESQVEVYRYQLNARFGAGKFGAVSFPGNNSHINKSHNNLDEACRLCVEEYCQTTGDKLPWTEE